LEFDVEGARSNATPVHWAENLHVVDRIKAEPARDAGFHKLDDAGDRGLWIISLDKIEIALSFRFAQVRHDALVDAMSIHDDLALGCLPEHFRQADHGYGAARDQRAPGQGRLRAIDRRRQPPTWLISRAPP
jgi:hypothetical protein